MRVFLIILLLLIQGCAIYPTQNSKITFICYKRDVPKDAIIKYKCTKDFVKLWVKFQ